MLVKICGLTRREDAEAAAAAGADLIGVILVPGARRAVDPASLGWLRTLGGAATVGVFRDAPLATVLRLRSELALDWVQLHGEEPDAWLEQLGPRVIRRVAVTGGLDWERVGRLSRVALPLLDPGAGDGEPWDWRELAGRPAGVRVGVAGGLAPETVAAVVTAVRPDLVDVSSGVEAAPGVKDPERVRAFITRARAAAVACGLDGAAGDR